MAVDAELNDGVKPWQSGGHGKFFVTGWQQSQQQAVWQVHSLAAHEYELAILLRSRDSQPLTVEVTAAGQTIRHRVVASHVVGIEFGSMSVSNCPMGLRSYRYVCFRMKRPLLFSADVHAIETGSSTGSRATGATGHGNASRLQNGFGKHVMGFMVHWTTNRCRCMANAILRAGGRRVRCCFVCRSCPGDRSGVRRLYYSHAYQYFPAPLQSLDKILPGRTTRRDLIGELADELQKRNMRLMLYYHLGTFEDTQWLQATKFWDTDTSELFRIGKRLSVKPASDTATDWQVGGLMMESRPITIAAHPGNRLLKPRRAGNANRLISFNVGS